MKTRTPRTVLKVLDSLHTVIGRRGSQISTDILVSPQDRQVLRELGSRIAEIGALPIQQKRKDMWRRLNRLDSVKPMVWLNNVPWHEMDVDDELVLKTHSPFCRQIELELRQTLYRWIHMPCDMVVAPIIYAPLAVTSTGIGIEVKEDILRTDEESDVVAHRFHRLIEDEDDIEKIRMPTITHDNAKSEEIFEAYKTIFDGILLIKKLGAPRFHFAPWDYLVRLTGVQDALLDLKLRPSFIHKLVDRLTTAFLHALDQYESLNLLTLNNDNRRTGSGAYGYSDELPQYDFDEECVQTKDVWGSATAQIFAEVSPEMYEEFALNYERRWLERFGLSYYGCCEPLFKKMDILRKVPNLRKISASAWNDVAKMAEQVGGDYVFSFKPNPAVLAPTGWNPDFARDELVKMLEATTRNGCHVEIIMKDISTVHYEPQRLWEWAGIATEVAEEYAVTA